MVERLVVVQGVAGSSPVVHPLQNLERIIKDDAMINKPVIDIGWLANDLRRAREEITLQDLTDDQWNRVCNRIANALHQQGPIFDQTYDWDDFFKDCGAQ